MLETRILERAVLVGAALKTEDPLVSEASLLELQRLTETAGGAVARTLTQRLDRFQPSSLIGQGKILEVASAVREEGSRTVIFDTELTPAQQKNLEAALGAKIVDRTRLILDIFARRARTKEGELQVELAQLSYMLPRLTGAWRGFSQQVGGIGTRGPGERKLEYERRHIQRRIEHLRSDIARMETDRAVQRRKRLSIPVPAVAVIGYTNAGKSSLLNRLTGPAAKEVYADDKLFATLDPTARRVRLPKGGWAVFTDTVGFISRLPTALIAAFRSTLEEVSRADCLLHLEDSSAPRLREQRETVLGVLRELSAGDIPRVSALNKADLLPASARRELLQEDPQRHLVSALTGEGVERLLSRLETVLEGRWVLRELTLEHSESRLIGEIHRVAQVVGRSVRGGRLSLRLRVTPENWSRLLSRLDR
ncbi:MAG: GTPase HflX [Elusimicrobiota bacterium]